MDQTFLNIGVGTEVLALLVSLITFSKYKHGILKYFPVYLASIAFLELFCLFFYRRDNVWLFNINSVIEFHYFAFIFWNCFNRFNKKLLLIFIVLYNSITIINYIFDIQDFLVEPISYSYVTASFIYIVCIILLFNQMLRSNVRLEEILGNLLFWVCMGLLIFVVASIPIQAITSWKDTLGDFRFSIVYVYGSAAMLKNILFIFGFLWSKKIYTY